MCIVVLEFNFLLLFYLCTFCLHDETSSSNSLCWQLGIVIRASSAGHFPSFSFILVSMGSTAVLLLGWRTLLYKFLPGDKSKKSDVYRRGSPFELFEVRNYFLLNGLLEFLPF